MVLSVLPELTELTLQAAPALEAPAGTAKLAVVTPAATAQFALEAPAGTAFGAMYAAMPVPVRAMSAAAPVPVPVQVQDILNDPSKWPASFARPVVATRILTYVFDNKDEAKVDAFIKFVKENFPDALLSVVKDNAGFTTTTITQVGDVTAAAGAQAKGGWSQEAGGMEATAAAGTQEVSMHGK